MTRNKYKYLGCSLILCFIFCALLLHIQGISVAAESENQTITIGYIDYKGFINCDENGNFSGYGVDYLNEISKYTGWKYKYVYGTWSELMKKVASGEIDFLCHAQYSEERAKNYDYSKHSIGIETAVLYVLDNNPLYYYNDFESFSNIKIGVMKGSYQNEELAAFAKNKFTYTQTEYSSETEAFAALEHGEVEAVAMGSLACRDHLRVVCNFGADPFYFITGKNNQEKLTQLNGALDQIKASNYSFESELYEKYYGNSDVESQVHFTREEQAFIDKKQVITVGNLPNRYPISSYNKKTGVLSGINESIMSMISEKSGLKFDLQPIALGEKPVEALKAGKFDLVCGIYRTDYFLKDPELMISDTFLKSNIAIVSRKGETYDTNGELTIAINKSFESLQKIIAEKYPQYHVVLYDTVEDCFDAVKNKKADILMQNTYVTNYILQSPYYENLETIPSFLLTELSGIAGLNSADMKIVMSILNKTIASFQANEINEIVIANTVAKPYQLSVKEIIYKYRFTLTVISGLLAVCIFLLVMILRNRHKHFRIIKTKNIQLGEALTQAQSANNAKSMFLSRMSHEIRTPMNTITGFTTIAQEHLQEPDRVREDLEKINTASNLLLGIINDVLDMSSIENEKLRIAHEPFNLKEVLNRISSIYSSQCKQKGIEYSLKMTGVSQEHLIGDSLRLNQILLNLISNAYKFTDTDGTISVTVEQKGIKDNRIYLCFTISDTGCGMEAEMLDRLFKPFEQESATTAQKYGGSGLGLSITKNLVDLMHGAIVVKSEKGKGTVFTVNLAFDLMNENIEQNKKEDNSGKLEKDKSDQVDESISDKSEDKNAPQNKGEMKYDFTGKKVLLAEDYLLNSEIAKTLLQMVHINVDTVLNGEEAVSKFESSSENEYQAILMDIQMPVMNGYQATEKIRKLDRSDAKKIKIYAMTANAFTEDITTALAVGMNGYIAKPIDTQVLYQTLEKCFKECEENE